MKIEWISEKQIFYFLKRANAEKLFYYNGETIKNVMQYKWFGIYFPD